MDKASFTVYFEDPFWVGVYQREESGRCAVCKVTFGAEPRDHQVYEFLLQHWSQLKFSPSLPGTSQQERRPNPKRLHRQIRAQMRQQGVGTKAQQMLKLQQEQQHTERKAKARAQAAEQQERRFALRQEKRRKRHRGH